MKRVCVFCSSSPKIPQVYFDAAKELANSLVKANYGLVYGGGSVGLMGCLADEFIKLNGEVIGVIPDFMVEVEWQHQGVKDMRKTKTMSERKKMMVDLSDAVIALPGSTGTLDELFEVMSDKKLGLLHKPLILLNTNHFYDHLIAQLQIMVDESFMRQTHMDRMFVANTPQEAVEHCSFVDQEPLQLTDAAVK